MNSLTIAGRAAADLCRVRLRDQKLVFGQGEGYRRRRALEVFTVAVTDAIEYSITGRVLTILRTPLRRVRVVLTRPDGTTAVTTTSVKGRYAFVNLPANATYALKPRKRGWVFRPSTAQVTIVGNNVRQNFRGTQPAMSASRR